MVQSVPSLQREETSRVLNRDIVLLAVLAAIAVGLFLFTRKMAAKERQMESRVAVVWYEKGERQLTSGAIEQGIESLRNAVANDRENRKYAFALANALTAGNHDTEARQVLLRLRESDPENANINLYLARLAAKHGDIPESVHYYENALYGLWTGSQVDERRRQVRIELIRFLLGHRQHDRALSELLILNTEIPDAGDSNTQLAELFLAAGDAQHALKSFTRAIQLDPHNTKALSGAGEAAFRLDEYVKARRYLEASLAQGEQSQHIAQLLWLVRAVSSSDPLAPHISMGERQRRVLVGFEQAFRHFRNCLQQAGKNKAGSDSQALEAEALKIETQLHSKQLNRDPDLVRSGMELIYGMEKAASSMCGEPTGMDEALLLIGRKHGGGQ